MLFIRLTIARFAALVAIVLHSSGCANTLLQKCCELNEVYDLVDRVCVTKSASEHRLNAFEHLFDSHTKTGPPKCDGDDDVAVEYDSEKHSIKFDGDYLSLPSHANANVSVTATPNSFCIDNVMDDGIHVAKNTHWMAKTCQRRRVCDNIPCVRKCCGEGEKIQRQNATLNCGHHEKGIKPIFHNVSVTEIIKADAKIYGVLHYQHCDKYRLDPDDYEGDIHHIDIRNGDLHVSSESQIYGHKDYCVDVYQLTDDLDQMGTFVCFSDPTPEISQSLQDVCKVISAIFLGVTLLIYLFVPSSLNIHEKALIRYVACLFIAFILLASKWHQLQSLACTVFAYVMYFGFLSGFAWLSVMCFDIWSSLRLKSSTNEHEHNFLYYSIYAWGVPLSLLAIIFSLDTFMLLPDSVLPNIALSSCWFHNKKKTLIYFLTPAGLLIGANCLFCVLTIINLNQITRDANRENNSLTGSSQRLITRKAKMTMHIKLIIVMGVPWLFEILSTIFPEPKEMWFVTDLINALQGLFIFIIFVLNQKMISAIKAKLGYAEDIGYLESSEIGMTMCDLSQKQIDGTS